MNPVVAHFSAYLSQFGASAALNDLDGDGLANDVCYVDTRTPASVRGQVIFGLSLAAVYALLILLQVVFWIFVALIFVCLVRGIILYLYELAPVRKAQLSAERLWLTFFGRLSAVTGVPVTSADMMEHVTRP